MGSDENNETKMDSTGTGKENPSQVENDNSKEENTSTFIYSPVEEAAKEEERKHDRIGFQNYIDLLDTKIQAFTDKLQSKDLLGNFKDLLTLNRHIFDAFEIELSRTKNLANGCLTQKSIQDQLTDDEKEITKKMTDYMAKADKVHSVAFDEIPDDKYWQYAGYDPLFTLIPEWNGNVDENDNGEFETLLSFVKNGLESVRTSETKIVALANDLKLMFEPHLKASGEANAPIDRLIKLFSHNLEEWTNEAKKHREELFNVLKTKVESLSVIVDDQTFSDKVKSFDETLKKIAYQMRLQIHKITRVLSKIIENSRHLITAMTNNEENKNKDEE